MATGKVWESMGVEIEKMEKKITPPKINSSNLKMMGWKMIFLFQGVSLRFHVNLRGCIGLIVMRWVSLLQRKH